MSFYGFNAEVLLPSVQIISSRLVAHIGVASYNNAGEDNSYCIAKRNDRLLRDVVRNQIFVIVNRA